MHAKMAPDAVLCRLGPNIRARRFVAVSSGCQRGGRVFGRGIGAVAGVVLAWSDLFTNTPEAWKHQQYGLSALYLVNGALGAYVAVVSIFGYVPAFWPVFILSIAISIGISKFKDAAVRVWISHCKFSMDKTYSTLTDEVSGFNSAA